MRPTTDRPLPPTCLALALSLIPAAGCGPTEGTPPKVGADDTSLTDSASAAAPT